MLQRFVLLPSLCALSSVLVAPDSLLWNHVGYERTGPKTAVVKNSTAGVSTTGYQLLDASGNCGNGLCLALDSNSRPQIVYADFAGNKVRHAGFTGCRVCLLGDLREQGVARVDARQ